jgi:NitT/TauT family transport system substrate-binding protein
MVGQLRYGALGSWALALLASWLGFAGTAAAQGNADVTLRLDWATSGYHAPFFLGVANGAYAKAGLNVKVLDGKGSSNAITLVGNDADTFAFADATTAARLISQGLPAKVVMGVFQRSTLALIFPLSSGIAKPADIKGKRISMCPGDGLVVYLPAYLKAIGLQMQDVRTVMVDCSIKITAVAQGQADAMAAYATSKSNMVRAGVKDVGELDYADAEIYLPSHGIVASERLIRENPDVIRRFVRASAEAWAAGMRDPDAAIAATVAANPLVKGQEAVLKESLLDSMPFLTTPATKDKPFGWQSPQEWERATQLLIEYTGMPKDTAPARFYTNDFTGS